MGETLSIILSITGLVGFIGGAVTWYAGAVRKRYAAERDFDHLKRNYRQMAENQKAILKELDDRFDRTDQELIKLVMLINTLLVKAGGTESEIYRANK